MTDSYQPPANDHDGIFGRARAELEEREAEEGLPSREWEGPPWPTSG